MQDAVIVSCVRTPVGSFGGTLKTTPVVQLGAIVLKEALKKAGLKPVVSEKVASFDPDSLKGTGMIALEKEGYDYDDSSQPVQVDEVIMGNVVGAGQGQNVARQAMIRAGISKETSAFTINKVCASGMKAVALAAQAVCDRRGGCDVGGRHGKHEPDSLYPSRGPMGSQNEQCGPGGSDGL